MKNRSIEEKLEFAKREVLAVLGAQSNNVVVIRDRESLSDYISRCIETAVISVDTETNNSTDPTTCELMGLCLYAPGLKQAYVPVSHADYKNGSKLENQLTCEAIATELKRVIESKVDVVMHNGKFDYQVIKCTCGVEMAPSWDTMIAARLLNENEPCGLKWQYVNHIDRNQEKYQIDKLFDLPYAWVDPEVFALYAATDSMMTHKLYMWQKAKFSEAENRGLLKLFLEIEMPIVKITAEIELIGVCVDEAYCDRLTAKYKDLLRETDEKIDTVVELLKPWIEEWKSSERAQQPEIILETPKDRKNPNFAKNFPYQTDFGGGLMAKRGKRRKAEILSDPIKMTSPKQTSFLFFEVLGVRPVPSPKPLGTGEAELELIEDKMALAKGFINELAKPGIDEEDAKKKRQELRRRCIRASKDELEDLARLEKKCDLIIELCHLLDERREIDKLIAAYLKPIHGLAQHWPDHKVRFQLKSIGAGTGRFTAGGSWFFLDGDEPTRLSGMNQQNIPANDNHEIRPMFRASPGRVFVGGDFGQQEPKMAAYLSHDTALMSALRQGKDIYSAIAEVAFDVPYEDCLEFYPEGTVLTDPNGHQIVCGFKTHTNKNGKTRRKAGKTILLAVTYGMGVGTVARKIDKTKEEAEKLLDTLFSEYPGLKRAMVEAEENCKRYGYVEGLLGRRRRLPNIRLTKYEAKIVDRGAASKQAVEWMDNILETINSKDGFLNDDDFEKLREEAIKNGIALVSNELKIEKARRQCFNSIIQGSAATMTKKTMILVCNDAELQRLDAHIVFQIHDELILECPEENGARVRDRLKYIMEHSVDALWMNLPMSCDTVIERRWGETDMTVELRADYQEMVMKGAQKPIDKMVAKYPEFPKESIERVVSDIEAVLEF